MKSFRILGLFSILVVWTIAGCQKKQAIETMADNPALSQSEQRTPFTLNSPGPGKYVPNQILVHFKESASEVNRSLVLQKISAKRIEKILTRMMKRSGDNEGVTLLSIPGAVPDAIAKIQGLPEIKYAEPNYIYNTDDTSNDPYFVNGSLWGMYGSSSSPANTYGSQAAVAWGSNHTGSSSVYVGIIDQGYMYAHTDLMSNAGVNPGEIPGNGIDDDGNGYIDDVYGWDFYYNDNTVFNGTSDSHGTHVAGTIGARGGNGIGVAGVCWTIKLMDAKFLGRNGGTTANAVKAVDYFTDLKTRSGINLVATNNSWGGGGYSQALYDAINRANSANILFVAAAGNNSSDNDAVPNYPSNYALPNVIAVASITSSGSLSSFSNYGAQTVNLGAPGSGIISTVPVSSKGKIVSGYASYSGTSMATPHVTGAAALYAANHPGSSAAAIKSAILGSVIATNSLSGKCTTGGRLNVSGF